MRKLLLTGCGLVLILYLLPVFWPADQAEPRTAETVSAPQDTPADIQNIDYSTVTVEIDGTPTALPLETYVAGVVAAEIPNDFPEEAIRAQAVAARTYAVYKCPAGGRCASGCRPVRRLPSLRGLPRRRGRDRRGQRLFLRAAGGRGHRGSDPDLRQRAHRGGVPLRQRAAHRIREGRLGRGYPLPAKRGQPGAARPTAHTRTRSPSPQTISVRRLRTLSLPRMYPARPKPGSRRPCARRQAASSPCSSAARPSRARQCASCSACNRPTSPSPPPRTASPSTPSAMGTASACRSTAQNTWPSRARIIRRSSRTITAAARLSTL